jgi:phosphoribosylanthranilate isomerase
MNRTRVKVCGITRLADARAAETAGCDAIGFVFWNRSPRCVTVEDATEIARKMSPAMTAVGVFVSPSPEEVADVCRRAGLGAAQVCGVLPEGDWSGLSRTIRLIRSVGIGSGGAFRPDDIEGVNDVLVDSHTDQSPGGTGQTFDWSLLNGGSEGVRLWLAGGLHAGNVGDAIRRVHPFAVDVSTGVEDRPGIKSHEKIIAFVAAVQAADYEGIND